MLQKQAIIGSDMLDHLGLVVAMIDRLGISQEIDKRLPYRKKCQSESFFLFLD